jgi:hypothetical protein
MKCLTECGYQESPDNLLTLTRHVQSCPVAQPASAKSVVWSNGEFNVVSEVSEEDTVIDVTFNDFPPAPEVKPLNITGAAALEVVESVELETPTEEVPAE